MSKKDNTDKLMDELEATVIDFNTKHHTFFAVSFRMVELSQKQ